MNVQRVVSWGLRSAAILAGMGLAAGCNHLPESAIQQIRQADQAYRLANYRGSEQLAAAVIRDHSHKPDTAEAYYLRGISGLQQGHRKAAVGDFRSALRLCRRRELESALCVQLGNLALDDRAYASAAGFYGRAVDDLPANVPADQVWYRYGLSLQRGGYFVRARDAFRRVVADTPSSPVRGSALRKMAWPHDYFTVQCGVFSRPNSAAAVVAKLRRQGIRAVTSRLDRRDSPRYAVHAGRYRNYASASEALSAIRRIQSDAFLVP